MFQALALCRGKTEFLQNGDILGHFAPTKELRLTLETPASKNSIWCAFFTFINFQLKMCYVL